MKSSQFDVTYTHIVITRVHFDDAHDSTAMHWIGLPYLTNISDVCKCLQFFLIDIFPTAEKETPTINVS